MNKFDFQDGLIVAGVLCTVGGIAAWSRPAAAIVLGLMCLSAALMIERTKRLGAAVEKGTDGPAK
jgi:hypothetical protein